MAPGSHLPELTFLADAAELGHEVKLRGLAGSADGGIEWEYIALTVTNAAFWTSLASVIKTFITRHRGKKVILRESLGRNTEVEITNYSPGEIEALLRTIAEAKERWSKAHTASDAKEIAAQPDHPSAEP